MKILFAVNNDNVSEAIVKKYQKEYKEILSYKNVYYFNAIVRELQKDKSYSRIVISEDLEPFANNNYELIDKFLFEKYSAIREQAKSINNENIDIIIICADRRRKTDDIILKIYKKNIYNAIIGQDRTIDEVCKLINTPKEKEDARIYYGIQQKELSETESENSVSEAEVENIIAHYARLGKNEERYVESFNNIVEQYNDEQLKIIIKYLPMNVKAVLEEKSRKYQQLAIVPSFDKFDAKKKTKKYKDKVKKEQDNEEKDVLMKELAKQKNIKDVVIPTSITTKKMKKDINFEEVKTEVKKELEEKDENQTTENPIPESVLEEKDNQLKSTESEEKPKRGRGRPRKNPIEKDAEQKPKRGRGRPRKEQEIEEKEELKSEKEMEHKIKPQDVEIPEIDLFKIDVPEEKVANKIDLFDEEENEEEQEIDLFDVDNEEEKNEEEQEIDLFDVDDEEENEEEQEIDLFDVDNEEEENEEEQEIDLFDVDDEEENEEEQEIDLFDVDDEEENEEEQEIDLFDVNNEEEENEEEQEIDLFDVDEEEENEEEQEIDLFDVDNEEEENEEQEMELFGEKDKNNEIVQTAQTTNEFSKLLTSDKKIVAFVGTTKNGTSFIVNNTAEMLANMGIKTAILDMTKSKNAYYIYTDNREELRSVARECMENLEQGQVKGINVNKNLTVYTEMPGENKNYNIATIFTTLLQNYSAVLIDADFDTKTEIFEKVQEIYLVQTMDVLTIQPLTAFLRNLKSKGVLKPEKLKIVINKAEKVGSLSVKTLIGGMSCYNSPDMTYMTELFNRDNISYCQIQFEIQNYVKYLEALVNCKITLNGYTKRLIASLKELSSMVYPLISKKTYSAMGGKKEYRDTFSSQTNATLNKMKNNY